MNIALIMAKEGSIGLPGKNTWKIQGKTMLSWTIEEIRKNKLIDKIFVSTNGSEVAAQAKKMGVEVIVRDHTLARNDKFLDAVDHAIQHVHKIYPALEIVAIPQCVVPFRDPDIFDRCISFLLQNTDYDSAVTVRRVCYIPGALMRLDHGALVPYLPGAQDTVSCSRQDSEVYEIDHTVECFRYRSWLHRDKGVKPWNYLGQKIKGLEQTYHNPNCFVDVHTIQDIRWLEFIVSKLGFSGMPRD